MRFAPVGSTNRLWSRRGTFVFGDQSAKAISADDPARWDRLIGDISTRSPLAKSLVWPRLLVVLNELAEHVFKVATTEDQEVIEDLAMCCATHLSATEFRHGRPEGQADDLDALAPEHLVERPNLASRSRSRNRGLNSPSEIRHASWRACWATQSAKGLAVQPAR